LSVTLQFFIILGESNINSTYSLLLSVPGGLYIIIKTNLHDYSALNLLNGLRIRRIRMEETQLAESRIPIMERYKVDKKLLPKQREKLIEYDEYNQARGLTICSRYNYLKSLRLLALEIKKSFEEIKIKDLLSYFANIKAWDFKNKCRGNKALSKETIWGYQTNSIVFFDWLGKKEIVKQLKKIRVKKSKNGRVKREDLLDKKEIKIIIDSCKHLRDKVLISLLYEANARRGEIIGLKIKDISFDEYGAEIKIRKGKTEYSERKVPIIDSAPLLKDFINNEHPLKDDEEAFLFLNIFDQGYRGVEGYKRLEVGNTGRIISQAAKRAGIKKRVYAHLLRHSRTTHLLLEGVPAPIVQQMGGWKDIQQLSQRYGHVTSEDARTFLLKQRGIIENGKERDKALDVKVCPRCNKQNFASTKYCDGCWLALDIKVAINDRDAEREIKKLFNFALKNPEMNFIEIMETFRKY
jgi:integrase/recombinase XerD